MRRSCPTGASRGTRTSSRAGSGPRNRPRRVHRSRIETRTPRRARATRLPFRGTECREIREPFWPAFFAIPLIWEVSRRPVSHRLPRTAFKPAATGFAAGRVASLRSLGRRSPTIRFAVRASAPREPQGLLRRFRYLSKCRIYRLLRPRTLSLDGQESAAAGRRLSADRKDGPATETAAPRGSDPACRGAPALERARSVGVAGLEGAADAGERKGLDSAESGRRYN